MSANRPVVAAIPNYNMAESLSVLLPQLAAQEYADIFVLDDASTDHSREVVRDFDSNAHFISSSESKGAGAARNLIIGRFLGHRSIIHFMDADVDLVSDRTPELANELMPNAPVIGSIGGLITTPTGSQSPWNYGPYLSPK